MSWRPLAPADVPAAAVFLAADEERRTGVPSIVGEPDLRVWLSRVELESGSWLLEEEGGIAALGWVESHGEVGIAIGAVAVDRLGQGLGSELVRRAETRLRELGSARVHAIALAADEAAPALLAAHGYREVRRFWDMGIDFDGAPPEPVVPEGVRLERFGEAAARDFHAALEEAFADHWEHTPQPFEEWWERKRSAPDYDPELWFLARAADEVAAAIRNDPNRHGGGYVGALGVRRAWRGRGVGKALLQRSFCEFHRRGLIRATLGVDAENPTGATRLYEAVGMRVLCENVVYEKALA